MAESKIGTADARHHIQKAAENSKAFSGMHLIFFKQDASSPSSKIYTAKSGLQNNCNRSDGIHSFHTVCLQFKQSDYCKQVHKKMCTDKCNIKPISFLKRSLIAKEKHSGH